MLFSSSLAFLLWCQFLLLLLLLCLSKWTFLVILLLKVQYVRNLFNSKQIGEKNIITVAVDCC